MKKIERSCINCGKKFLRAPSEIKNYGGKYCSRKCHYEHFKTTGRFRGENHPRYNPVERICRYCGKPFLTKKCLADRGVAIYCNEDCREKAHRPINRICRYCGKEFLIYKSRLKEKDTIRGRTIERGSYCSRVCLNKARSEFHEYLGENHCNWTGGYFPYYGEKWSSIRNAILKRANKSSEISHKKGEKLHIHHIIPLKEYINKYLELCINPYLGNIQYIKFSFFSFDLIPTVIFEEANSPDNLIVLTMYEHKKYEGAPIGFFDGCRRKL